MTQNTDPADAPLNPEGRIGDDRRWAEAAYRLAAGHSMKEVAEMLGCSRQTVWRTLQRSPRLRARIDEERRFLAGEAAARIRSLHERVVAGIEEQVARGNTRVLIWLARELDLFGRSYAGAGLARDHMLRLSETRETPPDETGLAVGAPLPLEPEAAAVAGGAEPQDGDATPPKTGCTRLHGSSHAALAARLDADMLRLDAEERAARDRLRGAGPPPRSAAA